MTKDGEQTPLLIARPGGRLMLHRSDEVDYIVNLAIDEARAMVQAQHATLYVYSEDGSIKPYGDSEDPPGIVDFSRYCAENRISLCHNPEAPAGSGAARKRAEVAPRGDIGGIETETPVLSVFLSLREGDLGVLTLYEPRFFSAFYETDLNLVKNFAAAFSILITSGWESKSSGEIYLSFKTSVLLLLENAHLQQQNKDANYRLEAVLEDSNLINSSRELTELVRTVLYSCRRVMRAQSASMFLVDEETGELYFDIVASRDAASLKGLRIPPGQGIVGLCAQEKRSIVVNDAANDPRIYRRADEVAGTTTRNLIAAPMLVNDRCIGVIEVINTIDRPSFSNNDLELFESFSDSVALAVQRRVLLDELQKSNQELERKLRETRTLHEVAAALVEATSVDDMFARVLAIIRGNLRISRLSILLYEPETDSLRLRAWHGDFPEDPDRVHDLHNTLSGLVFQRNEAIISNDLASVPELKQFANVRRYATGTCILLPIVGTNSDRPIGVFCASDPEPGLFIEEDSQLLSTLASQIVRGYENFRLSDEILARQAIEKEVEITSGIQKNILPESTPEHLHLRMGARSVMARTTGGDFYDYFIESPNGPVTFLVADVSGKSLPAALFMAVSSSILRTIMRFESNPTTILARANDLLYEESQSGMFVTVFLARYEPDSGRLSYASAGHNEMLLLHVDGSYEMLSGRGAPLGVLPSYRQKYVGGQVHVRENDQLILYTDGVVEAVDPQNEEYGFDRFVQQLRLHLHRDPGEIIEYVYRNVTGFSGSELQTDDFTMLISRFHGTIQGMREYHIRLPAQKNSIRIFRDQIMQLCMKHGLSGHDLDDILLVADEAATNIVVHAYGGQEGENSYFDCDLQIDSENMVRLQFRDQGQPFMMQEVPSPNVADNLAGRRKGGFGVYLMKSLMQRVEYARTDGVNYLIAERSLKKKPATDRKRYEHENQGS